VDSKSLPANHRADLSDICSPVWGEREPFKKTIQLINADDKKRQPSLLTYQVMMRKLKNLVNQYVIKVCKLLIKFHARL
jgi:hypothetical protein